MCTHYHLRASAITLTILCIPRTESNSLKRRKEERDNIFDTKEYTIFDTADFLRVPDLVSKGGKTKTRQERCKEREKMKVVDSKGGGKWGLGGTMAISLSIDQKTLGGKSECSMRGP